MKTLLSATCLLLACHVVQAGTPGASSGDAKPAASAPYVPAAKSDFGASPNEHNPFWPIGWAKAEALPVVQNESPVIPRAEDFIVTSILLNEPPMAVINGKEMAEGEIAALTVNGHPVMVQLMAVQDGRVILRWQNQNIIVLIHRLEDLSPAADSQHAVATMER